MSRKIGLTEAKHKAIRFCAYRERSPKEVIDKLKSWGIDDLESQQIIRELLNQKFVDPQRFADAFCHDKFKFNQWGRLKIKRQLHPHQLSEEMILKALSKIHDNDYYNTLYSLAEKKLQLIPKKEDTPSKKRKIISYLSSKGFESDLIKEALDRLLGFETF